MGKAAIIQSGFAWGEMSSKLTARVDLEQYDKACVTMENAYPFLQGGVTRRPGTFFIGEVLDSSKPVRLIPFIFSTSASYVLVFNNGKIQFIDKTGNFVTTSPGVRYSINHPFSDAQLSEFTYAQAGIQLFLCHNNHAPISIEAVAATTWVMTYLPIFHRAITDYWFENFAMSFKIISDPSDPFKSGDRFYFTITGTTVGAVTKDNTSGGAILGGGNISQVTATGKAPNQTWYVTCLYAEPTREIWSVSGSVSGQAPLTWSANDYPGAVAYYGQRLYFAGSASEPQTIWGSSTNDYTDFTQGSNDDDGFRFTVASNSFDKILHLASARNLLPLTYSAEFSMTGAYGTGITPSAVKLQPETFHGTTTVKPIRIGSEIIFLQRDRLKVRAISYSVTEDTNVAPDITLYAEHITESGIKDMTFAQDPDYVMWAVKLNGELLSLTLSREYQTTGWARHKTEGLFENVTTIPGSGITQVFVCVNRTVNGSTKRYIELLDYTDDLNVDSGQTGSLTVGVKSDSWSGLSHLEGKWVDVVADGVVHPQVQVISGTITLQYPVNKVRVGLHYDTTIEMVNPEFGDGRKQTTQGRAFSIYEVHLRLHKTINCKLNDYNVPFRTNTMGIGTTIQPFTGDKVLPAYGWRRPSKIKIQQVTPMPFTLLGVVIKGTINE